ncbi:thiamine pyrophosphate-dependent dehydrogenase E1 component subunit alpha [Magnetospira sp. QH-2]|uniref:thiamine pyrophosphate-dependent dehydrogenase E1 component subunit alpha n=1 Tax=Magnetospira sp. (strain QH-2) TaxID=1288970 RepID=UPI00208FE741|nr:thiamine pyrophosphate-dependent dehydrogenase E1 component subunit alpha [Magnetospira sp. QH-2]
MEEEIIRLYPTDKIKSPVHLSIGQEFVSAAVCAALMPDDTVFATYRSHAAYIAKGGDLKAMWAELYGKRDGCARGKAGSMHLIDQSVGMMGTSAIVGTTLPNAVGYAWALQQQNKPAIVASFFGEGATDEGAFHEALNFAALKRVPILFICENNGLAIYSRTEARMAKVDMCERARVYGMTAHAVDSGDILDLYGVIAEAVNKIRRGESGPVFVDVATSRWRDHVGPGEDFDLGYRRESEVEPWKHKDSLVHLAAMISSDSRSAIESRVNSEIAAAIDHAEQSPFADLSELTDHLFRD